jgi:hypothetical protein
MDLSHIDKMHKQEMENKKDKKLQTNVTTLFYSILTCFVFAFIIFTNLSYYGKTPGFKTFMIILMFVFIIMIPILTGFLIMNYSKLKRIKRR